jgi:hypothetical protein
MNLGDVTWEARDWTFSSLSAQGGYFHGRPSFAMWKFSTHAQNVGQMLHLRLHLRLIV